MTNCTAATTGLVRNRETGLLMNTTSHSRGPWMPFFPAGGRARSSSVIGPPSTQKTGMSMVSIMCCSMCGANIAMEYRPSPEQVTKMSVRLPSVHQITRLTGHSTPRLRRTRHAHRYTACRSSATVPKIRSKRQWVNTADAENGSVRSNPRVSSAGEMSAVNSTGGGMRDREIATPTVAAMMRTSTIARRTKGRFHQASLVSVATSSCGMM